MLTFGLIGKFATVEIDFNYIDTGGRTIADTTQYKGSISSFWSNPNLIQGRTKINKTWTQ